MNRHPVATNYYHVYAPHQQHYHEPVAFAPHLRYRQHPLQLPLQQQRTASSTLELPALIGSQHFDFRQAPLAAAAAPPRHRQHSQQTDHEAGMAFENAATDEMAEFQKLSNEYEPEATGPLVGQRQSSTAIASEYSLADPIFRQKTAALPQKYSHYRTARGDGRCGWRSIAFGYFEGLLRLGDADKILEEETRLRSMNNLMVTAGYSIWAFEDMADLTFDLLRQLGASLHTPDADDVLLEAFNDETLQNNIIGHMKFLACAWMKTRPEEYEDWLVGQTVDHYCDQGILPIACEIEHVGIVALTDALLKPAGMALEILYLDRTPGSEANFHSFAPISPEGHPLQTPVTVRLLYRPGHYDLIYKQEDVPPESLAVPTYLQFASHSHQEPAFDLGVSDFMTMIPGMSYANTQSGWVPNTLYDTSDFFASTSAMPCQPPEPTAPTYLPSSMHVVTAPQHPQPPPRMHHGLTIRTAPQPQMSVAQAGYHHLAGPFRSSAWELQPDFVRVTTHTVPLQTSIFRNSHFNTAHFLNPEFQPEEWSPGAEYVTAFSSSRSSGSKHKASR